MTDGTGEHVAAVTNHDAEELVRGSGCGPVDADALVEVVHRYNGGSVERPPCQPAAGNPQPVQPSHGCRPVASRRC